MPVIFSAFDNICFASCTTLMDALLPREKHLFLLDNVLYQGKNLLQQAISKSAPNDLILAIVSAGKSYNYRC